MTSQFPRRDSTLIGFPSLVVVFSFTKRLTKEYPRINVEKDYYIISLKYKHRVPFIIYIYDINKLTQKISLFIQFTRKKNKKVLINKSTEY